nr:retrovirus-related Pol polyprotein from transposon TNT 1-94 [Tanacetum cinerariifolium]
METKDTLSLCSNSEAKQMQQIQDKAKKSCMVSFRQLQSHLKRLSKNDLQGSQIESGWKRAFGTLSCQDTETFTGIMFLNVEHLEKQLDREDFQEIGPMATFNVLETQFQMFITNRDYLNDEYSIDERVQLKREYDSWVNERQMQTTEEKDTSSRSGNDAHDDDVDIRPIYDEEPMDEVQTTAKIDVFAIGQQHTEQPEFNNKGEVVQIAEECHDTWKPMSQPHRNQSVVRQPTAFKSEGSRISKPRCDSQVDVHNDLSKLVTTHYLPKDREDASAKPHHMITSSNSRISSKNMPRFTSNDMVHNHYLEEAKKKWKPTGKIFKTIGLRWVPNGRILTSSTTKVDSEPLNGSNADITNLYECEQTLDVSADADVPSQQELDILFGPLYDEFFNAGTNPSMTIPSTSAPSTHTNVHAEENNNDQAEDGEQLQDNEFTNPLCAPMQEVVETSSHNIEQVHGNPSRPVQTRRQLATDPVMCMYALTVSATEHKSIKEAMADSAWIEAMQEELRQFNKLQDSSFELTAFLDVDLAGCIDSRKSTSGGIQILGDKLVSWMSKKQNCTPMSSAELNTWRYLRSAIAISCNPVQHSRTKHIHTRYHFIKEQVENGIIELYFVRTEYQLAYMFTKALPEDRFKYLVRRIGMRCLTLAELEVLAKESA